MALLFWKNICLEVGFEGVRRGFLSEWKRKDIACRRKNNVTERITGNI